MFEAGFLMLQPPQRPTHHLVQALGTLDVQHHQAPRFFLLPACQVDPEAASYEH